MTRVLAVEDGPQLVRALAIDPQARHQDVSAKSRRPTGGQARLCGHVLVACPPPPTESRLRGSGSGCRTPAVPSTRSRCRRRAASRAASEPARGSTSDSCSPAPGHRCPGAAAGCCGGARPSVPPAAGRAGPREQGRRRGRGSGGRPTATARGAAGPAHAAPTTRRSPSRSATRTSAGPGAPRTTSARPGSPVPASPNASRSASASLSPASRSHSGTRALVAGNLRAAGSPSGGSQTTTGQSSAPRSRASFAARPRTVRHPGESPTPTTTRATGGLGDSDIASPSARCRPSDPDRRS